MKKNMRCPYCGKRRKKSHDRHPPTYWCRFPKAKVK